MQVFDGSQHISAPLSMPAMSMGHVHSPPGHYHSPSVRFGPITTHLTVLTLGGSSALLPAPLGQLTQAFQALQFVVPGAIADD